MVQKIAGIAAREISGVHSMGGGVSRAFGAIRERIPGGGTGAANIAGVQVEVGEKQAAVDLDIVVEYGASIVELARAVRRNVITAVERMTGLEVIEVNIAVNDIHLPEADTRRGCAPIVQPARRRVSGPRTGHRGQERSEARMNERERAAFRAFVREHHPDRGGDPEVFVAGLARFGAGGPTRRVRQPARTTAASTARSRWSGRCRCRSGWGSR